MDRRRFLLRLGLGVLGAGLGVGAVAAGDAFAGGFGRASQPREAFGRDHGTLRPEPHPVPAAKPLTAEFGVPHLTRVALPGAALYALPGAGNLLALTVDDGASSEVVGAYAELCARTGMRLTFFVTQKFPSWSQNAAAIRPLVESGRIQLGNHTVTHPDLRTLSAGAIQAELTGCGSFIRDTFGVDAAPYYRPPFGCHDDRVHAAARAVGYTQPVLWYGTLSDSALITEQQVVDFATQWFLPQHIVIGHANFDPVTHVFDQLTDLIRDRQLQPVTLDDVFVR